MKARVGAECGRPYGTSWPEEEPTRAVQHRATRIVSQSRHHDERKGGHLAAMRVESVVTQQSAGAPSPAARFKSGNETTGKKKEDASSGQLKHHREHSIRALWDAWIRSFWCQASNNGRISSAHAPKPGARHTNPLNETSSPAGQHAPCALPRSLIQTPRPRVHVPCYYCAGWAHTL